MTMTSRERMLTALSNGRPDRLPCQVHGWMDYYLNHYLDGMDWWQACERFGLDYARLQEKDGKTIDTVVQLGQPARLEEKDAGYVEVLGGLRAGDRLVKP